MSFEKNTLIGEIAEGKFPQERVKTKYGEFVIEFPSGQDKSLISYRKASCCNGLPMNSYSMADIIRFDIDSTLSVVIKDYPKDFPEDWKKENISSFPDQEVKDLIFKSFNTFFDKAQKRLSGKS